MRSDGKLTAGLPMSSDQLLLSRPRPGSAIVRVTHDSRPINHFKRPVLQLKLQVKTHRIHAATSGAEAFQTLVYCTNRSLRAFRLISI